MSAEAEPIEQFADNYPHRTFQDARTDLDAERILDGYLEHQDVDEYSSIESEFPYQAALGRTADLDGEVMLTSRYTFPEGEGYAHGKAGTGLNVESTDKALEGIIPDDAVLDAAGVEIDSSKRTGTPDGGTIDVDSVHCVVFYEEPVMNRKLVKEEKFRGLAHKKAAMQSLNEPSVATAMITSGREKAGVQVDYWTRSFDGIDEGLDYGELNWDDPGEF